MPTAPALVPYRRPLAYRLTWATCWLAERLGATVPLERAAIERRALDITGRSGFLGSAYREPLDTLLHSLHADARLSPLGRNGAMLTLARQLVTRLCMEEAWGAAAPGPGDLLRPARPPVFVVGMHRTGTTLLHRLMAAVHAAEQYPSRVIHVHYKSLVDDPINTVRGIYERAGLAWDAATGDAVQRCIADNPRSRHAPHRYGLGDFGLTESSLLEACPGYVATERRLAASG